jgi:hypothetical protein
MALSGGYATPHVGREVAGNPTAAPPASIPFRKPANREASLPSSPTAPSVVILNPGTADVRPILRNDGRTPDSRDKQPPTDSVGMGGGKLELPRSGIIVRSGITCSAGSRTRGESLLKFGNLFPGCAFDSAAEEQQSCGASCYRNG